MTSPCSADDGYGTCYDAVDSYSCSCSLTSGGTPYTGSDCQTDWFCDSGLCLNGASCLDGACSCTVLATHGYTGALCQTLDYSEKLEISENKVENAQN